MLRWTENSVARRWLGCMLFALSFPVSFSFDPTMSLSSPPDSSEPVRTTTNGYWRAVVRFTVVLLAVWAAVSLVAGILLVEPLNAVRIGRLPAGFWMAQQGSIIVFVALIFVYARRMDRLDHEHRKDANGETDVSNKEEQP